MTDSRQGDWIQTYTGKSFWPLDPRPEDVCIEDIAHSHSCMARFLGHARLFYSVAQHSCAVSEIVEPRFALLGLMHDAAEAYVGDWPRPLKALPMAAEFKRIERRIQDCISERFNLVWTDEARTAVHHADMVMLSTEAHALMIWPPPRPWNPMPDPSEPMRPRTMRPWDPSKAEYLFLERFHALTENKYHAAT